MAKLGKQQELECRLLDMLKEVVEEVRKEYPDMGYFDLAVIMKGGKGHWTVLASKNTEDMDEPYLDAWETEEGIRMSRMPKNENDACPYHFIPGYEPESMKEETENN